MAFPPLISTEQPIPAQPQPSLSNVVDIQDMADRGGMDILTEEEQSLLEPATGQELNTSHYENLAAKMDKDKLDKIAQELIELVEQDEDTRDDWNRRVEQGLKYLGVSEDKAGGADFEGASKVVHPLLMDAVTQFQSRAIQEMWPSKGPVSTQVLGPQTEDKLAQAERVKDYMNYLYTTKMPEAFVEEDNMLLRLPISGSCFKKMFYCPLKKRLSSIFVEPADFIIDYTTTDLSTSPRYTHRIREYQNNVKKKEQSGFYIEVDNNETYSEDTEKPSLIDAIDRIEGKEKVAYDEDEDRVTIYEIYCDYSLEDKDDDILKPYIITVDRDMQQVRRIQRNWKPDDESETKRQYFAHYRFTPGLGFYGYGFLHLIGDIAISATGSLRSLMDAAGFANMQGGFRSRDSRLPGGDKPIAPGEWREVNSTAEELGKGFFPLPYKEPSATLFNLLGYLDEKATQLVGNTETVSGDSSPKDAPVGTTAMLIEQGMKVFTSIHKRLHEAHKNEFRIMAELVEEYMPDEGYPYVFGTHEATLLPQDFDSRIDVIPVSDPNLASTAQRVAKAQSLLELRQQFPEIINEREACRRMLIALDVDNIEAIIGTEQDYKQQMADKNAMMEEEKAHARAMRQLELEKQQAEIESIQSETVVRNVEATAKALESAGLILAGVPANTPAAMPAPQPNSDGISAEMPIAPEIGINAATGATTAEMTTIADSILSSSGFIDKTAEVEMPDIVNAGQVPTPQSSPGVPGMAPPMQPQPPAPPPLVDAAPVIS